MPSKCIHSFESDGGKCIHCHKSLSDLTYNHTPQISALGRFSEEECLEAYQNFQRKYVELFSKFELAKAALLEIRSEYHKPQGSAMDAGFMGSVASDVLEKL